MSRTKLKYYRKKPNRLDMTESDRKVNISELVFYFFNKGLVRERLKLLSKHTLLTMFLHQNLKDTEQAAKRLRGEL